MFTLIDLQLVDPGEDDAIGSTTTKTKLYYYEQAVSYLKITSLPFSDQRFLKAFSTADFSKEWSSTSYPDSIRKKYFSLPSSSNGFVELVSLKGFLESSSLVMGFLSSSRNGLVFTELTLVPSFAMSASP